MAGIIPFRYIFDGRDSKGKRENGSEK